MSQSAFRQARTLLTSPACFHFSTLSHVLHRLLRGSLCVLCVLCGSLSASAELPSPADHARAVRANSHLQVEGKVTGEGFCWHAAYAADSFVEGYEATGNVEWLVEGKDYFNWLVGLMEKGPDGYRGWIGPFIYEKSVWCDVHVGDAILIAPMLRFAEVVLADSDLEKKLGKAARNYVKIAKRDLIQKWDARGTWRVDGPYGAYASWDRYLAPGDFTRWREMEISKSNLSLPFNKQFDVGICALRLYRITGDEAYQERAKRIFRSAKSRFRLVNNRYVWNYWEPLGPWDFDQDGKARHWVNVHPYRNYQAGEVGSIAEAYQSGIVFDESDIRRIINTNLKVMWNGDLESPAWRNSNATGPWTAPPPPPKGWKGRAGTLWSSLAAFDPTVRMLLESRLQPGAIARAHYYATTAQSPPGFGRRYAAQSDPTVFTFPHAPSSDLRMVAALPSVVETDASTILSAITNADGLLEVSLYSADGAEHLLDISTQAIASTGNQPGGPFTYRWCPSCAGIAPGDYIVRWTQNGQHRDFPITVAP